MDDQPRGRAEESVLLTDLAHQPQTAVVLAETGEDFRIDLVAKAAMFGEGVPLDILLVPLAPVVALGQHGERYRRDRQVEFHAVALEVLQANVHGRRF